MNKMLLQAIQIHKTYNHAARALHVLKGVDLEVDEGTFFSIIGPSGAGKSTLLHILGGLDRPDQGRVFLDKEELYRLNDHKLSKIRNEKIGFVFQFYHLLPEFTALENVIFPALVKKGKEFQKEITPRGLLLLERVGLSRRVGHKPSELSGGEQQRVAIARALMNEPKVIFCDEPTGNLDSQTGNEIIHLLKELNQGKKQTIVMVTHDKNIAEVSHKTLYMRDGQLIT